MNETKPICTGCNKRPDEIDEYIESAKEFGITPDEYVRHEEVTFDKNTGHFVCTDCYFKFDKTFIYNESSG